MLALAIARSIGKAVCAFSRVLRGTYLAACAGGVGRVVSAACEQAEGASVQTGEYVLCARRLVQAERA